MFYNMFLIFFGRRGVEAKPQMHLVSSSAIRRCRKCGKKSRIELTASWQPWNTHMPTRFLEKPARIMARIMTRIMARIMTRIKLSSPLFERTSI